MLQTLTTEGFAQWFGSLDDEAAEEVATAIEVVEELGPLSAFPGSRESLLWYEHPSMSRFQAVDYLALDLECWGSFRDYAKQVLERLESPRFASRLSLLAVNDAATVLEAVKQINRASDPRMRWIAKLHRGARGPEPTQRAEDACAEVRRWYLAALAAAGFEVADVPAHSLSLREIAKRSRTPGFRLLYGVHAKRGVALFVVGEWLDRSFYGDSVRRAEGLWKQFLEGSLQACEPAVLR